jgi:bifunctional enzyme CysN/CysC
MPVELVLAGPLGQGKSALLARLLTELELVQTRHAVELGAVSAGGVPAGRSSLPERSQVRPDQALVPDAARVRIKTPRRTFVFIDPPGHGEPFKTLLGGGSAVSAALLVLDAQAEAEQPTLHHAHLLRLLGVRELVVAINKMDLAGYAEAAFRAREREVAAALQRLELAPGATVPVCARDGANLSARDSRLSWHAGPSLLAALEALPVPADASRLPLRLPVQEVYRDDAGPVIAGRVESGRLAIGDELLFSPSGRSARVAGLLGWPNAKSVSAGENASVILDRPLAVERGELASHREHPPKWSAVFDAEVFWLAATPLSAGREFTLELASRVAAVRVQAVRHRIDPASSEPLPAASMVAGEVARITLRSHDLLALDDFALLPATGRFLLREGSVTVGGGVVDASGYPDQHVTRAAGGNLTPMRHQVTGPERMARLGHAGAVVWFTGLPGAGKSTLAMALERRLFDAGYAAYVLDGDNIRRGLNANLGFSPQDRQENIRRIGEVAALFADAGFICIAAFISPYRDDRQRAREATRGGRFFEVYVRADLAVCEARDPKGLYWKARHGEIKDFTGIDSPYEEPETPELVVDTAEEDVAFCVEQLFAFVTTHCRA